MNGNARNDAMKRVQKLAFMKTETELFLDTHPDCRRALDYYHKIVDELSALREEYANMYGPITACESMGDRWTWIDGAWPWQHDFPDDGMRGTR